MGLLIVGLQTVGLQTVRPTACEAAAERMDDITPELLLRAYSIGVFPMADSRDDPTLFWVEPDLRGVIPLDGFHLPRRLRRTVMRDVFQVRVNTAFRAVMEGCASAAAGRADTWISGRILDLYSALFAQGHAHSIECWQDERLVGGLYGVSIGAAFFGESMFSLERDASKVALVHLVGRLRAGDYRLLDTQFVTDHLAQFGVQEIPKATYLESLREATRRPADFYRLPFDASGAMALQSITQTS